MPLKEETLRKLDTALETQNARILGFVQEQTHLRREQLRNTSLANALKGQPAAAARPSVSDYQIHDVSNLSHAVSNTAVKTHIRSSPYARQRTNILPSTDSSIIPFADSTRNPPAASPSEAPSPYPDEQPRTAKETYDPYKRRKRRKMREDSEEGTPRNVKEPSSTMKTAKGGKGKRSNERRRTSNKVLSLEAFNCDNIDRSKKIKAPRLTLKPSNSIGLFKRGRSSKTLENHGLPDLAFTEMAFLDKRRIPLASNDKLENKLNERTEEQEIFSHIRNRNRAPMEKARQPSDEIETAFGQTSAYREITHRQERQGADVDGNLGTGIEEVPIRSAIGQVILDSQDSHKAQDTNCESFSPQEEDVESLKSISSGHSAYSVAQRIAQYRGRVEKGDSSPSRLPISPGMVRTESQSSMSTIDRLACIRNSDGHYECDAVTERLEKNNMASTMAKHVGNSARVSTVCNSVSQSELDSVGNKESWSAIRTPKRLATKEREKISLKEKISSSSLSSLLKQCVSEATPATKSRRQLRKRWQSPTDSDEIEEMLNDLLDVESSTRKKSSYMPHLLDTSVGVSTVDSNRYEVNAGESRNGYFSPQGYSYGPLHDSQQNSTSFLKASAAHIEGMPSGGYTIWNGDCYYSGPDWLESRGHYEVHDNGGYAENSVLPDNYYPDCYYNVPAGSLNDSGGRPYQGPYGNTKVRGDYLNAFGRSEITEARPDDRYGQCYGSYYG